MKDKKKILYYTIEGYDTPNPVNHLMDGIIESILESRNECHLMQSYRTDKSKSIPNKFKKYKSFSSTIIKRKNINKQSFIKRYIEESFFSFNIIKYRKQLKSCDVILMQSTATSFLHILFFKLFIRKPLIYNIYDVFPGHAYDIGVIKSKILYNSFRVIQKLAYMMCDQIIVMCEDMKNKIIYEGVKANKIQIIYNWFDDTKFHYIQKSETQIFKKYMLDPNLFYLQYAGTLGQVFDERIIIELAQELSSCDKIKLLLIGDGVKTDYLKKEVKKSFLNNIIFLPLQPLEMVNDVYNACDVGLIPLKKGVIGNGFPSKACQLMACGKPIYNICDKSFYTELFEKYNMGLSNTNYDVKKIKRDILNLFNERERLLEMGKNGQNYVYKKYSKSKNAKKFVELCLEVIEERRKKL